MERYAATDASCSMNKKEKNTIPIGKLCRSRHPARRLLGKEKDDERIL